MQQNLVFVVAIIFTCIVSLTASLECRYFDSEPSYAELQQCRFQKTFPIKIQAEFKLIKDIQWQGPGSWYFFLSNYQQIKDNCLGGMPFPGLLKAGQILKLQLECESLPRPLQKSDWILFVIDFKNPNAKSFIATGFLLIPITQQ